MAVPQWASAGSAPALGPDGRVQLEEDDESVCSICLDRPRTLVFVPCGHHVTCRDCATDIRSKTNQCPICRCTIDDMFDTVF